MPLLNNLLVGLFTKDATNNAIYAKKSVTCKNPLRFLTFLNSYAAYLHRMFL